MALQKKKTNAEVTKRAPRKRKPSSVGAEEQLRDVNSVVDEATERVKAMESELTENAWRRRPGLGGWSALECVEHLNLTAARMIPKIEQGIAQAEPRNPSAKSNSKVKGLRLDFVGWMLYKSLGAKGTLLKSKTGNDFQPKDDLERGEVLQRFYAFQEKLKELAKKGEQLRIDRIKVTSPFNERVKYNLYSALHINAVHSHRHLDQAERAAKSDLAHELI